MSELTVYADGGSRGNPGPAGCGAVVFDADGTTVLAQRSHFLGVATNNVAEYRGMLAGIEAARAVDPDADLTVRMDSKLVVEQMSGRWKIKHPDMAELAATARALIAGGRVTFEWIPRAKNAHADRLANQAMDTKRDAETTAEGRCAMSEQPQPADGYAGDVTCKQAWAMLRDDHGAVLLDVRTDAEWAFVGVPTLTELSGDGEPRRPLLVQWVGFPDGHPNPQFVEAVQEHVPDVATPILCLCRSGGRSVSAAKALTAAGFSNAMNVLDGFEGDMDAAGHRGHAGWRADGLPWRQS